MITKHLIILTATGGGQISLFTNLDEQLTVWRSDSAKRKIVVMSKVITDYSGPVSFSLNV